MGAAITESLTGNTKKFELIGQLIGQLIVEGIKATLITSLDNLGSLLGKGVAIGAEYSPVGYALEKTTGFNVGDAIRSGTTSATSFGEQLRGGLQSEQIQQTIKAIDLEHSISNAMSKSITMDMPQAVREGILEAQKREMNNKATFSN